MEKICLQCNKVYKKGYHESKANWSKRKYCSINCIEHPKRYMPKFIPDNKGRKHTEETIKKNSESKLGEKHWRWISDRTKLKRFIGDEQRRSSAYNEWRKQVRIRDGYKCRINNKDCVRKIESHHILSWKEHPELRFDVNNGITLCHFHHPRGNKEKELSPYFQELILSK